MKNIEQIISAVESQGIDGPAWFRLKWSMREQDKKRLKILADRVKIRAGASKSSLKKDAHAIKTSIKAGNQPYRLVYGDKEVIISVKPEVLQSKTVIKGLIYNAMNNKDSATFQRSSYYAKQRIEKAFGLKLRELKGVIEIPLK